MGLGALGGGLGRGERECHFGWFRGLVRWWWWCVVVVVVVGVGVGLGLLRGGVGR